MKDHGLAKSYQKYWQEKFDEMLKQSELYKAMQSRIDELEKAPELRRRISATNFVDFDSLSPELQESISESAKMFHNQFLLMDAISKQNARTILEITKKEEMQRDSKEDQDPLYFRNLEGPKREFKNHNVRNSGVDDKPISCTICGSTEGPIRNDIKLCARCCDNIARASKGPVADYIRNPFQGKAPDNNKGGSES